MPTPYTKKKNFSEIDFTNLGIIFRKIFEKRTVVIYTNTGLSFHVMRSCKLHQITVK